MQAQAPVSMHAYFNEKKASTAYEVMGIEGSNSMNFVDNEGKQRGRGIRQWEKARYENYDRKMKQEQFYDNQRKLQKYKNQSTVDAYKEAEKLRKEKEQQEAERMVKYMKELEKIDRVIVEPINQEECNDAW